MWADSAIDSEDMAETFHNNWMTQLRKGLWEFCVLKALEAEPSYGYDIVRRLSEIKGLFVSEATIYLVLRKLRRAGLVKTSRRKSVIGPPRKYYELTARGRGEVPRLRHFWRLVRQGVEAVGAST